MLKSHLEMSRFRKTKWKKTQFRDTSLARREKLGKRLRELRIRKHLTQQRVAGWLGQDQPSICKIESGRRAVEFIEVENLAEIYKKPLSYFATLRRRK